MLRILLAIFLLIPLPVFAYHTETQTPYGITNSLNNDGSITVSWQESDGLEDNQPEYYIVYIGLTETADDVSVQTTFGFTEALSWQSHSFTAEYLYNNLSVDNQKIYAKVKAFHDTNGTTSDFTQVESVMYDYEYVPASTTTSSTTTSSTTTSSTTTTTTVPPPPPPPPPPEPVEVVMDDGSVAEYEVYEVEDGTVDRDNQRKANEESYGCYMTDAQIERGDCDIPEEEPEEEVIIVVDEKSDTKEELPDDDDMVLEVELEDEVEELELIEEEDIIEEEVKIDIEKLEEDFKFEEEVFDLDEIVIEEDIDEEVEEITEEVLDEPIQEDVEEIVEDELYEEIPGDDIIREEELQEEDVKDQDSEELTEEEVAVEVAEVEEVIEDIVIEEVTTEEVIEVIEQVNDIGVQNLDQATEEVQEVVQAVVEEAIENVEELTQEQVAVVAEVLQVEEDDVDIIAEAVKEDKVVAEAVEEYVERAVENADVENYTLADVVTEVQYEAFLENPIETFVDLDLEGITISNIGDDMTQDQKEKAQEVVVPVILTRIASMAAFVFRRSL